MIEDQLFDRIDPLLRSLGATLEAGEAFRSPALDVLRYYRRPVKLGLIPFLSRGLSVVSVVRQPMDVGLGDGDYTRLLRHVAMATSARFPPWKGFVIGLTCLVLTPEPIGPGDDTVLGRVLDASLRKYRVVPFGLFRVNLGQEALSFALRASPDGLFPEPERLADALSEHLRRFVPLLEM
jgi:hypothetical protein